MTRTEAVSPPGRRPRSSGAAVQPARRRTAGAVLSSVISALHRATLSPRRLQQVAWAASGALAVDGSTSPADLASLAGTDAGQLRVLPVGEPVGGTLARFPTDATRAAVAAAGLSCDG